MADVSSLGSLKQIAEGKTKIVLEVENQKELVVIRSKDVLTAFNAVRRNELEGKAHLSNVTTSKVFDFLNTVGLRTHFIRQLSDTELLAEKCAMIPLEWVTRRVATGSFLKRHGGVKEGFRFTPPKMEIFYKDDAMGDPEWSREVVLESKLEMGGVVIGEREVELMSDVSVIIFEILEKAWARLGCTLVDMKVEYGVNSKGDIILADVIDSDSWRLWPAGDRRLQVDKQFYRDLPEVTPEKLKELKGKFEWVTEQLKNFTAEPKGRVVVLMGSASDKKHGDEIKKQCMELGIPAFLRVASAHKDPWMTMSAIAHYEGDGIPTVFVAVAGRSNGLGPVTAGCTSFPVINCPPLGSDWGAQDIWSSLRLPSGLGCSTTLSAEGAALAAAKMLGLQDHMVWCRLRVKKLLNHISLMKADRQVINAVEDKS